MSSDINAIPSIYASGKFEAAFPFDTRVESNVFYTVEAIRTVSEMQGLKLDLYKIVLAPAGIPKEETTKYINEFLENNAVIVTLTSKNSPPVYVPSTYIKSFPLIDGVIYENYCIVSYLGACPPSLKNKLQDTLEHIDNYLLAHIGIKSNSQIATFPTRGYVSKEQAEAFETSRQLAIKDSRSDVLIIEEQADIILKQQAQITRLENALKAKT